MRLDVPTARANRGIGAEDLEAELAQLGEELRPGDIMLLRTGCSDDALRDPEGYATAAAGLDRGGAEWVRAHGVKAVGIDCVTIESVCSARTADTH